MNGAKKMALITIVMPNNSGQRPDDSWRDKFFNRSSPRTRLDECLAKYSLVKAPPVTHVSDAMRAARREDEAAVARDCAIIREAAVSELRLVAEEAEAKRREREQWVREDVARFGANAVLTLHRRLDPNFQLPADLESSTRGKGRK